MSSLPSSIAMRATRPGTPPDHTHRRPHTAVSPRSPLVRYLYPIPAQLMQPAKQFNDTTSHSFLLATIPFQLFHHRTICRPSTAQHDFFKKIRAGETSGAYHLPANLACGMMWTHPNILPSIVQVKKSIIFLSIFTAPLSLCLSSEPDCR